MEVEHPRRTLAADALFEGFGLHSGEPVTVSVHPGAEGIRFYSDNEWIDASPQNVTDTRRCTVLGGKIATVEHLLSALAGLGVTDADIEVDGPELPAMGGASADYCEALTTIPCGYLTVDGPYARVYHTEETLKIAISQGIGHWRYTYDVSPRWPSVQEFEVVLDESSYRSQVAPARTFALEEEMEMVRAAGLAKGLDETSAFVIGRSGYINAVRFPDEPARHKMLDLIGDLSLSGVPARLLNVVAEKSGHRSNVEAAAKLASCVTVHRR